jgi:hypothetical protein
VFSTLKRAAPSAELDALVYLETAPMLARHPAISVVHTIDRSVKTRGPLAQFAVDGRLWSALRARHYDLVVHLTEHPRGAWLSRITGARYRVAPERARAGWFWRGAYTATCSASTPRLAVGRTWTRCGGSASAQDSDEEANQFPAPTEGALRRSWRMDRAPALRRDSPIAVAVQVPAARAVIDHRARTRGRRPARPIEEPRLAIRRDWLW